MMNSPAKKLYYCLADKLNNSCGLGGDEKIFHQVHTDFFPPAVPTTPLPASEVQKKTTVPSKRRRSWLVTACLWLLSLVVTLFYFCICSSSPDAMGWPAEKSCQLQLLYTNLMLSFEPCCQHVQSAGTGLASSVVFM